MSPHRRQPAPLVNATQAEAIRRSWASAATRSEEVGRLFYGLLFERVPQTRTLFPVNLQTHRSRLLRGLVHVVQMVDRPEQLTPLLTQLGRDHRKFGITTEHYEAVGAALLGAVAHCCGDAWTPDVADAYTAVSERMIAAAATERGPASWLARVTEHRRMDWDLAIITVQALQPIPYWPGQYLSVEIPPRPRLWRYLSPANPARPDGLLQFHVRAVPGGWVSPALAAHTRVGDTWRIGPPMGQLHRTLGASRDLLMIAGGTGIAPINALLGQLAKNDVPQRTHVFVGGRTWNDLYNLPNLTNLASRSPWLDIVPVLEHSAGQAEQGTLAEVVTRHGPWTNHEIVVAGSPSMIRATTTTLISIGVPPDRIHHDPLISDEAP